MREWIYMSRWFCQQLQCQPTKPPLTAVWLTWDLCCFWVLEDPGHLPGPLGSPSRNIQ